MRSSIIRTRRSVRWGISTFSFTSRAICERATEALERAGWRALLDTPRHRVFARPDERIVRPASEDPDNPIRLELHTSFRLPVLGRVYDASEVLRAQAQARDLGGTAIAVAAGPALATHLLFHAAEDFAGNGIRGIQAYDFRLLARAREWKSGAFAPPGVASNEKDRKTGALAPEISSNERGRGKARAVAPLLYAADAIERLFPLTFEELFLSSLSSCVPPELRRRAAVLPALRYTHPARGWTRTLLSLVEGPIPRARFLLRTLFPTLGEVKANVAPEATGLALVGAWVRVLARRVRAASPALNQREARRGGEGPSVNALVSGGPIRYKYRSLPLSMAPSLLSIRTTRNALSSSGSTRINLCGEASDTM